jgi:leader peptidase (prepilin peptidase)/N-methyltransferase
MIAAVDALLAAWTALLGAVVGSFLNVVVARVPHGLSVVHPRSRCPRCLAPIAWYDNLPVLSWLLLRGRCRGCRLPISRRYPLVEASMGALAVVALSRHGFSVAALSELVLDSLLVSLLLIDLDTWLLPHALTWPLLGVGLLLAPFGLTAAGTFTSAALGAGIGFAAFGLVSAAGAFVFKKEALGFGDVWLLAGIGAWLGVGALLPVVLFASLQGSVVGIALMLLGKGEPGPPATPEAEAAPAGAPGASAEPSGAPPPEAVPVDPPKSEETTGEEDWVPPRNALPFGPFLALATFEWLFAGAWLAEALPFFRLFR